MTKTPLPEGLAPLSDFESQNNSIVAEGFAMEQWVFDNALLRLETIGEDIPYTGQEFALLAGEYGRLLRRAQNTLGLARSMIQRIHELQEVTLQDPLTGIRNRRYLEEHLDRIVKTLRRSGSELGVLMIDVDYFKQYNDMYGHSTGDAALKRVAAALEETLTRTDDFVVRYGGEEFAVILPNTGECGARLMAEKMLESVRLCGIPYECNSSLQCITVSIGIAAGKVTHCRCRDDFIKLADEALYHAKNNGRNSCFFRGFA